MKWYSQYKHPDNFLFIIEDDKNLGYFFYLYEDTRCFEEDLLSLEGCPNHQDDYLQDTLEMAQKQALKQFGVPLDSWIEAKPV